MKSTLTSKEISTSHQHLFISTSSEELIEDYIANTRHKIYLLYIRPIELTSNIKENNGVSTWSKDIVCHPNCIFKRGGFILVFVERIQKDEFSKKPQVQMTSKRTQHNVELFLRSELGHSPNRNVKLLGR